MYRDGQNEYLLNGTQVRLKDVIRPLAGANIGGSVIDYFAGRGGQNIECLSEGREMVEDAWPQAVPHKKAESERQKRDNIDKTKSLRR